MIVKLSKKLIDYTTHIGSKSGLYTTKYVPTFLLTKKEINELTIKQRVLEPSVNCFGEIVGML